MYEEANAECTHLVMLVGTGPILVDKVEAYIKVIISSLKGLVSRRSHFSIENLLQ